MSRVAVALAVLALAAWTRASQLDWDGGHLLHPDERFLTMVAATARIPESAREYLDPTRSPLAPANLGFDFFVYGTLPLALGKLAAVAFDRALPAEIAATGRTLAAAADVATTALVMAIAALVGGFRAASWAGLAYALAVLAIQQAHFFTVDAFVACFGAAAIAAALAFHRSRRALWLVLTALGFGLALACKLSAGLLAPLLVVLVWRASRRAGADAATRSSERALALAVFAIVAYVALRAADPPLFAAASWLDLRPAPGLVADLAQLRALGRPGSYYPPAIQWHDRTPVAFALSQLAGFGVGLPWIGLALLGGVTALRGSNAPLRWLTLWALAVFLFHATQTVQPLRYFLPIVPVLAVLAGSAAAALAARPRTARARAAVGIALALALGLWPASFLAIYARPHSRVAASAWLLENVPPGAVIAVEHWDDALPLPLGGRTPPYAFVSLPVFDPDTPAKWEAIERALAHADWYVLSSNRAHTPIERAPALYPRGAVFYRDLLAGRLGFERAATFSSFPTLFGVAIDDQGAEESFTVYDHPQVIVLRRPR